MGAEEPRIEPVPVEDYHRLERELFGDEARAGTAGVSRMWAHNPGLMKAQRPLQEYLLGGSTLPPRDRELAILRVTWLCGSAYAFGQHTLFGARAGLSAQEIRRVTEGPDAPGWTPFEAALLRAVDELRADARVSGPTWAVLAETYDTAQLIDLIAVIGRYWTVAVTLNSAGVPLDPDRPGFPERPAS
ncbi:carboxymuconolactone decarboxylase family protein [Spongiactinospora gelatinilytica]|uniref:Carboxymuconolactone decarboxylase family protein n=1 Tax=Spongiactinospora gelatinilytica TaxID=2666298 RepID=A0A2W2EXP5_9ACTN|nr:carboxymuconolactone decarboxylase family protein [Spongiactinospora gelatinilytica]PZG27473.1 carboxymuconolactone decarboxylase family protein [Spongiactinospora gelatinilytica]